jgi:hypothetical protein
MPVLATTARIYRIAVGPRAGQKLFTLQTVPARPPEWLDDPNGAARAGGFSLHLFGRWQQLYCVESREAVYTAHQFKPREHRRGPAGAELAWNSLPTVASAAT